MYSTTSLAEICQTSVYTESIRLELCLQHDQLAMNRKTLKRGRKADMQN